jgi:hypothetical protein
MPETYSSPLCAKAGDDRSNIAVANFYIPFPSKIVPTTTDADVTGSQSARCRFINVQSLPIARNQVALRHGITCGGPPRFEEIKP